MIGGLDFSIDLPTKITLIIGLLFPMALMLIVRIPKLAGRNALQFLVCFILATLAWIALLCWVTQGDLINQEGFLSSIFLFSGIMLVYLEIWGLLSRGYTLGLLLTFYKSRKAISINELAKLYRGGEGLTWLINHRFSGLAAAKMIKIEKNRVILTPRGMIIAYVYRFSTWFFGLRYSG